MSNLQGWQLKQRQSLPLEAKENLSKIRIREWYDHWDGNVYVSFSGGKDSTVLLHLVRSIYPKVPGVFLDTGLEYPEIRRFVKTKENIVWLRPKKTFKEVIETYGFAVPSKENAQKIEEIRNTKSSKLKNKRLFGDEKGNGKLAEKWKFLLDAPFKISAKCCNHLKKNPAIIYEKETGNKPFVGTMAYESSIRALSYLRYGCNTFETKRPMSTPISFWLEEDIWNYIKKYQLEYSSIYDMGYDKTGCMFCLFGIDKEVGENRFQKMKCTHPKQYDYCINKLGIGKVLDYLNINY